jgi:hypothetical protein
MYVRFNINKNGHLKLQQLLSLGDADGENSKPFWENVPTTGLGTSQSIDAPLSTNCGLFFIKENKTINIVSALSIEKIIEVEENKTRIDTYDKKKFFYINISQYDFILLMTKMLNNFMIINVDETGKISNDQKENVCHVK